MAVTLKDLVIESVVTANTNNGSILTSDDYLKNIEYYLTSVLVINAINKFLNRELDQTTSDSIEYIQLDAPVEPPITPPVGPPVKPPRPPVPADQLDIALLAELGAILSSYGYALANNIPVSINKNWDRVNFNNSYGTLIALSRKVTRLTRGNTYLNSGDFNLPAVDSSQSIGKRIARVVTGATLR